MHVRQRASHSVTGGASVVNGSKVTGGSTKMYGLFLDQMMFARKQSKFEAAGNACFGKDSGEVVFHGLLAANTI